MRNHDEKAWKLARRAARRAKESGRLETLTVPREDRATVRRDVKRDMGRNR